MTQTDLAESMGATQSTVSAWINGRSEPSPATVFELERTLKVSVGSLSRLLGYLPVESAKISLSVKDAVARDHQLKEEFKPTLLAVYRELLRLSSRRPGQSGRKLRTDDPPVGARRRRLPS
jgi:transcriptional regulator with XRE-family HTH domain